MFIKRTGSDVVLFQGAYSNGSYDPLTVTIHEYSAGTDDVLDIGPYFCLSNTEVNN
jgi:hypothetical protein